MTRAIIPDQFRVFLQGFGEAVELCDSSGRVLGTFVPGLHEDRDAAARMKSNLSDEEFERRLAEKGGKSLAEFWAEMGRS